MRRQIDEAFPTDGTTSDDGVRVAMSNFGQNSTVVLATRQGYIQHSIANFLVYGGGLLLNNFCRRLGCSIQSRMARIP